MSKKTILITGGCSGIGYELSKYFIKKNYTVISLDIKDKSDLKHVLKNKYFFYKCDLKKIRTIAKIYNKIITKFPLIDVLINNARSPLKNNFISESYSSWTSNFNINLTSHFFLSREFLLKRNDNKKRCYIINISSISGKLITSQSPSYNISKAGLIHMSNYFSTLGKKYNCNTNVILPGLIIQKRHLNKFNSKENKLFRNKAKASLNVNNIGKEIDIGNMINFLISGKADFINGEKIIIDGGSSISEQLDKLINF